MIAQNPVCAKSTTPVRCRPILPPQIAARRAARSGRRWAIPLRLHFHGAAGTVTGSCFLLETGRARVLVDCGMFQGPKSEKELNYRAFPFDPAALDAVVLTHAHIDHSGLLPKLATHGYRGAIHATAPTADLCSVMLPDSGYIQQFEVKQLNRRGALRGKEPVSPIYTADDAKACLKQFRPAAYGQWIDAAPGIRLRFWNAGHLLGSASAEIEAESGGADPPMRLLFSGDIGPAAKMFHPEPEGPSSLDYVVSEATYGATDRPEATPVERRLRLCDELRVAAKPNGVLLIPSFAVERTQELLADLVALMDEGAVPPAPVIIDSPLATRASEVFARHAGAMEEGRALLQALHSRHVHFTENVEQSKALDRMQDFHIVISASGMCEAGRIRFRLKNWLWRYEATVLLVGYQAEGTLGRILQEGAEAVRIQGEEIKVRARIRSLDLYSGHADAPELAAWMRKRLPVRHGVFLVHGEDAAVAGLRTLIARFLPDAAVHAPKLDDAYELTAAGAKLLTSSRPRRIAPDHIGRLDWHNDFSKLLLDIHDAVDRAADERARGLLLRKLRRALERPDDRD